MGQEFRAAAGKDPPLKADGKNHSTAGGRPKVENRKVPSGRTVRPTETGAASEPVSSPARSKAVLRRPVARARGQTKGSPSGCSSQSQFAAGTETSPEVFTTGSLYRVPPRGGRRRQFESALTGRRARRSAVRLVSPVSSRYSFSDAVRSELRMGPNILALLMAAMVIRVIWWALRG